MTYCALCPPVRTTRSKFFWFLFVVCSTFTEIAVSTVNISVNGDDDYPMVMKPVNRHLTTIPNICFLFSSTADNPLLPLVPRKLPKVLFSVYKVLSMFCQTCASHANVHLFNKITHYGSPYIRLASMCNPVWPTTILKYRFFGMFSYNTCVWASGPTVVALISLPPVQNINKKFRLISAYTMFFSKF